MSRRVTTIYLLCQLNTYCFVSIEGKRSHVPVYETDKQASSSGRAAEALGGTTGFIGFEALSTGDAQELDLSSEWKLLSKKLSKKDGVTRLKVGS
jgi:hypothetical protein